MTDETETEAEHASVVQEDGGLDAVELCEKYKDGETGHPSIPRADWQAAVTAGCTDLGYWEWVADLIWAWE